MCVKPIRDGDTKYGAAFDRVAEGTEIDVVTIARFARRMNSVCERFLDANVWIR